jgi:Rrf2 family protein
LKLSTKGEYGLLALVDLALQDAGEPQQASAIARRQQIPKQYLDQLLMLLKRSGLVTSVRGRQGGYRLARAAGEITLFDAFCALEGPLEDNNFIHKNKIRQEPLSWKVLKNAWNEQVLASKTALQKRTLEEIANASRTVEEGATYDI